LAPSALAAHQDPEDILEIVDLWLQTLKHLPELTLRQHLMILGNRCLKCFHKHTPEQPCSCACWIKIIMLLTNDVDELFKTLQASAGEGVWDVHESEPRRPDSRRAESRLPESRPVSVVEERARLTPERDVDLRHRDIYSMQKIVKNANGSERGRSSPDKQRGFSPERLEQPIRDNSLSRENPSRAFSPSSKRQLTDKISDFFSEDRPPSAGDHDALLRQWRNSRDRDIGDQPVPISKLSFGPDSLDLDEYGGGSQGNEVKNIRPVPAPIDMDICRSDSPQPEILTLNDEIQSRYSKMLDRVPTPPPPEPPQISCQEPIFVSVLKLAPSVDHLKLLESRSCWNCLGETGGHETKDCPNTRVCLNCFHLHDREVMCQCDCQRQALKAAVPKFDFGAMAFWHEVNRRFGNQMSEEKLVEETARGVSGQFSNWRSCRHKYRVPKPGQFFLDNLDIDIKAYLDKSTCFICLSQFHTYETCKEKYFCLYCFHNHHPHNHKKCSCYCTRDVVAAEMNSFIISGDGGINSYERMRRKRTELAKHFKKIDPVDQRNEMLNDEDWEAEKKRLTNKYNKKDNAHVPRNPRIPYEEEIDSEDEKKVNHVIPKIVMHLLQTYSKRHGNIIGIMTPSTLDPLKSKICRFCLSDGHYAKECEIGFVCLNCFHIHKIGTPCNCFCYLEKLTNSTQLFPMKTRVSHVTQLQKLNSLRKALLAKEGWRPVTKKNKKGSTPVDPTASAHLSTSTSVFGPALRLPGQHVEVSRFSPERLKPDEEVVNFKFRFRDINNPPVISISVAKNEPIAYLKYELIAQLPEGPKSVEYHGEIALIEELTVKKGALRKLIDGKPIVDYLFKKNVVLIVEFRSDTQDYQKKENRKNPVKVKHPIPPFFDDMLKKPHENLRKKLERNCPRCLDGVHERPDCKNGFFCLNCFHTHKMTYTCSCKCLKYRFAQVMQPEKLNLRALERFNCRRIQKLYNMDWLEDPVKGKGGKGSDDVATPVFFKHRTGST